MCWPNVEKRAYLLLASSAAFPEKGWAGILLECFSYWKLFNLFPNITTLQHSFSVKCVQFYMEVCVVKKSVPKKSVNTPLDY